MPRWSLTKEEDEELQAIFEGRGIQYDHHVKEYYFRRRTGLMVLEPWLKIVPVGNC